MPTGAQRDRARKQPGPRESSPPDAGPYSAERRQISPPRNRRGVARPDLLIRTNISISAEVYVRQTIAATCCASTRRGRRRSARSFWPGRPPSGPRRSTAPTRRSPRCKPDRWGCAWRGAVATPHSGSRACATACCRRRRTPVAERRGREPRRPAASGAHPHPSRGQSRSVPPQPPAARALRHVSTYGGAGSRCTQGIGRMALT